MNVVVEVRLCAVRISFMSSVLWVPLRCALAGRVRVREDDPRRLVRLDDERDHLDRRLKLSRPHLLDMSFVGYRLNFKSFDIICLQG